MKLLNKFTQVATASAIALSAASLPAHAGENTFTGNIGVYSKYLLRGIGEENSGAAVQGGVDYGFENGIYLGYWGSSLGYSYEAGTPDDKIDKQGFENDLYAGYAGSAGMFDYKAGLIQYIYIGVDDSNLTELLLSGGIKGWNLTAQYLLTDGWWGNTGDIYWTFGGGFALPKDFGLSLKAGYYMYNDEDNDKLGGFTEGAPATENVTKTTSEFRHLDIGITHPIGTTGATAALTYTIAGKDRTGAEHEDSMVMSAAWNFDI